MNCLLMNCLKMNCLFMKHPIEHCNTILLSSEHWVTYKLKKIVHVCVFYELSFIELSIEELSNNVLSFDEMSVYETSHRTPQYYSSFCEHWVKNKPYQMSILESFMNCPLTNCLLMKCLFIKHPIGHRSTLLSSEH